jgi:hypothetical protein
VLAFLIHNLGPFLDAEVVNLDRVVQVLAGEKKWLLLIESILVTDATSIELEDIMVVTSEILLLEASKGSGIFKDLLQKRFSASNTVHLTCDLICKENKATAVQLREGHVEDVDLVRLIYLV